MKYNVILNVSRIDRQYGLSFNYVGGGDLQIQFEVCFVSFELGCFFFPSHVGGSFRWRDLLPTALTVSTCFHL